MNIGKITLAGIVGGVVMFIWGAVAHMALPIGDMGLKSLPGEPMIMSAMRFSIQERGLYMFPGVDGDPHKLSKEQEKVLEDKYKQGPRGLVIYDPAGGEMMSMNQLGMEFASNVAAAILAAVILIRVGGTRLYKTVLATLIGVVGWLSINVSYWNWYRFPDAFTMGQFAEQAIGWLLSGAAIALVLGRKAATPVVM